MNLSSRIGPSVKGSWLVIFAAMLWGTTGTAQAFAPVGAQPTAVGAVRLVIGGLALLTFAMARGSLRWGIILPVIPTLFAAGGVAVYQILFFQGVFRTGVVVGTIVGIGSSPIFAGLLDLLIWRKRPSLKWVLATVLAILGAGMLLSASGNLMVDTLGMILSIGAGFSYAVYAAASKVILKRSAPDAAMAVVFGLGGLFLSPILLQSDLTWLAQPSGVVVALHLGLVATGLSYLLFAGGLRLIPVSNAVTLSLAEPFTAGLLGVFLLKERVTLPASVGIGLLLVGLLLLAVGDRFSLKSND